MSSDVFDHRMFPSGVTAMICPACGVAQALEPVEVYGTSYQMRDHPVNMKHKSDGDFWVCPDASRQVYGGKTYRLT